jgi:hypothetical protein
MKLLRIVLDIRTGIMAMMVTAINTMRRTASISSVADMLLVI